MQKMSTWYAYMLLSRYLHLYYYSNKY